MPCRGTNNRPSLPGPSPLRGTGGETKNGGGCRQPWELPGGTRPGRLPFPGPCRRGGMQTDERELRWSLCAVPGHAPLLVCLSPWFVVGT